MTFINAGGFVFSAGSGELGALFDGYYNPCQPNTAGVSNRQQVTVRVRQGVTQGVAQPQDTVVITVQQTTVLVPSQQNVQNPVRATQSELVGQEVPVTQVPVTGNQALEQFNTSDVQEPGATLLSPNLNSLPRITQKVVQVLGKETAAQAATAADLADDAVKAASSTVDDAALLANKLRGLSPAQIQQGLQKAGMTFEKARDIASAAARNNIDEVAALLRQQGSNQIINFNRQITETANRVRASLC